MKKKKKNGLNATLKIVLIVSISLTTILLAYCLISLVQEESGASTIQETKIQETVDTKKTTSSTENNYIIKYLDDGRPITWKVLDSATIITKQSLSTYKEGLISIGKKRDEEKENLSSLYQVLSSTSNSEYKQKIKTFISFLEAHIASADKLMILLSNLIKSLEGLHTAIEKRDLQIYIYYSGEAEKYEKQKDATVSDYEEKQKAREDYSKYFLENSQ